MEVSVGSHHRAPMRPLVILGPTASGKSDVAMALALDDEMGLEVVAVDSMQVYRGMDIGTAKPSAADRVGVRHHGVDLAEPSVDFTVSDYCAQITESLAEIRARSARPLFVAGTGLYLRALTDPMELPGIWPEVRARWEMRAAGDGAQGLHAILAQRDPQAAAKMEPTNLRRIARALEVIEGSGRLFSSFGPGIDTYPAIDHVMVGIRWERPALAARIVRRVERMVEHGLVDEVRGLLGSAVAMSRTARQALGYKELIEHLEGDCSLDEAVERIQVRTRQFAVRQERWFRRDPRIRWVDVRENPLAEVLPVLRESAAR